MTNMSDNFHTILRKLIESTGMSMNEISEAIGMSNATLRYYLSTEKPGFENLMKLADYFAVPLDYLTGRCTEEQAKEISENYSKNFMILRRAPYEMYLKGRKKIKGNFDGSDEPWPYNLMGYVCEEPWDEVLSEDQIAGINYALGELTDRERDAVLLNLRDGMTLKQASDIHGVTKERERQILTKAFRKLRAPYRKAMIVYGKEGSERRSRNKRFREELEKEESEIAELKSRVEAKKASIADLLRSNEATRNMDELRNIGIHDLFLSVRSTNCLDRAGCKTLGDVMDIAMSGNLIAVRNLGKRSIEEILDKIYEITKIRITKYDA